MNTVEILKETERLLKTHGRARGASFTFDGKYCLLGAVAKARGYHPIADDHFNDRVYEDSQATVALAEAIQELQGGGVWVQHPAFRHSTVVHGYNDETEDDAQIFAVINRAIVNEQVAIGA